MTVTGVNTMGRLRPKTNNRSDKLDDFWRAAVEHDVHPVAWLLCRGDPALASRLNEALNLLAVMSPDEGEQWLATGRNLAAVKKR